MTSNRKSPIWPYLVVLSGLFLLSLAAPRGWETSPAVRRELPIDQLSRQPPSQPPQDRAIVLRAKPHDAHGRMGVPPLRIETAPRFGHGSPFQPRPAAVSTLADGDPSASPDLAGDAGHGEVSDHEAAAKPSPGGDSGPSFVSIEDEPFRDITRPDEAVDGASEGDRVGGTELSDERIFDEASDEAERDEPESPDYDHWPQPLALIERLSQLEQHDASRTWAAEVRSLMDRLGEVRIDDPAARRLLQDLRSKAAPPPASVARGPAEVGRTQLDLVRRLDLWEQAAAAARRQYVAYGGPAIDTKMQHAVAEVTALVSAAPVGDTWREYLLLDRIERLAGDVSDEAADERRRIAEVVLQRMADPRLSAAQREFLARSSLAELKRRLRGWAAEELPVGGLLHTVEAYEQQRVASLGRTLAEQSVALLESDDPAQQRLGGELERHYRNANLRLVVTRELLNRMLPQPQPAADPVIDTIVGVPTRGISTTSTRLAVRLFTADDQIRFGIEASGVVDSQTASTSGPVTLHSTGESSYFVGKLVVIDRHGLRVGRAMAEAENQSRLAGLETDFDGVPLVRNLVRGYALSEHEGKQPQAQQEVEAKVAARASERLDAEVNMRLAKAEAEFQRRVLAPLARLDLDPTVAQLTTTDERVTARLRLAGEDQAGAHTPRPLALSNSLASLQLHESLLNNALDRLHLADRTFTLPELHQWIGQRLGRAELVVPDDLPENVVVTFAAADPIRLRCTDGRVELTLAIAELDDGRRAWYDFEITVYYRPRVEGLSLEFFREGAIELSGEAYAGRAAIGLRGIFAKVFTSRRILKFEPGIDRQNAALASLKFNSAVVDNGWISVSVADRN